MKVIEFETAKNIKYFDLMDFVEKIKIDPSVLEHMEETNKSFDVYFKKLSKFNDKFVLYFLISLARDEIMNNQSVENHRIREFDLSKGNLFFDSLDVDHNRIHSIHKFVMGEDDNPKVGIYRQKPARVSRVFDDREEIYWYGANPEDINGFMDSLLEFYKSKKPSVIDSNPFIKGSLVHLLLAKIQPYFDGNRRTARVLQNIKFTEMINDIYDLDLKISPINLSESIKINILSYIKSLNNTKLDINSDNNGIINYWFNVMLNMYDEQLFRNSWLIDNMDEHVEKILELKDVVDPKFVEQVSKLDVGAVKILEVKRDMDLESREEVEKMKVRKIKK